MKVIATKGSVNNFLRKHKDFKPLIDRVKKKNSTFLIENIPESIKDLKKLIPMFRANGTTNFSEITYENKPEISILGTVWNSEIKKGKNLLSPSVSMYFQFVKCNIAVNGPAYLTIHSVSDYKNTLIFKNNGFNFDFTFTPPNDPNIMLKPPEPVFDPYTQFSMAV